MGWCIYSSCSSKGSLTYAALVSPFRSKHPWPSLQSLKILLSGLLQGKSPALCSLHCCRLSACLASIEAWLLILGHVRAAGNGMSTGLKLQMSHISAWKGGQAGTIPPALPVISLFLLPYCLPVLCALWPYLFSSAQLGHSFIPVIP